MIDWKRTSLGLFLLSTLALAATTEQSATLRDVQTVGSTTKKQKHQQYDLLLDTPANEYTCRTKLGSSMKPTQSLLARPSNSSSAVRTARSPTRPAITLSAPSFG